MVMIHKPVKLHMQYSTFSISPIIIHLSSEGFPLLRGKHITFSMTSTGKGEKFYFGGEMEGRF